MFWRNGVLVKRLFWRKGYLAKRLFGEQTIWRNDDLARRLFGETIIWRNDVLAKRLFGETMFWRNDVLAKRLLAKRLGETILRHLLDELLGEISFRQKKKSVRQIIVSPKHRFANNRFAK